MSSLPSEYLLHPPPRHTLGQLFIFSYLDSLLLTGFPGKSFPISMNLITVNTIMVGIMSYSSLYSHHLIWCLAHGRCSINICLMHESIPYNTSRLLIKQHICPAITLQTNNKKPFFYFLYLPMFRAGLFLCYSFSVFREPFLQEHPQSEMW